MAYPFSDSTPEEMDSSGDEFVPNSQSSETEEEEDPTASKSTSTGRSQKKIVEDSAIEVENESDFAAEHAVASSRKRTNKHLGNTSRKYKRGKMNRNYSHASKINCCDVEVIKRWLCPEKECCKNKCFEKLQKMGEDGIAMVADLRHRRFAGPFMHPSKKFTKLVPTPG